MTWDAFLENKGFTLREGRAAAFGDVASDFEAFGRAALVPLLGVTPLRLTGADSIEFLHGQVSNEVKRLPVGGASRALMLNVKGHALAGMRIYKREDDLFVAIEGGAGARVIQGLRAHIIFDQVELEDSSGTITSLTLQGENAARVITEVLGEVPEPGRFAQPPFEGARVLVSEATRSVHGGYDLHVLAKDAPALFEALLNAGAAPAGEDALTLARVVAGLPAPETEGGEGVLPQEVGLEPWLSYRKGCYLGQEIMARIEARGTVRRELRRLRLSALPAAGARDILKEGKVVGRLGAVAVHPEEGVMGLGVVRKDAAAPESSAGGSDENGLEVGGVAVTLTASPSIGV